MFDIKSGWKTTEFWMTLLSQGVAIAVVVGLLTSSQADTVVQGVGVAVAAVSSVVSAVAYSGNRTNLKIGE